MSPHDALVRYFGFSAFRPGQEEVLQHLLAGRDALVVMPTGSGKSLIYQLAALMLPGTALVFSPLVALMKDQADGLTRRHVPATFINSTLDAGEQSRRLNALANSEYKIVLIAPERLRNGAFRAALAHVKLSLIVVDEAHCLSQWGHDFRPDYLHIAEARREFGAPLTLALTATATVHVQEDILRLLGLTHAQRLVRGFDRPNLFLQVVTAPDAKTKLERVREFLSTSEGAGIIYTGTRRDAEELAEFARDVLHKDAQHYHAGLDASSRSSLQDAFLAGDLPLVVATNAFGMGVDRPDVRFVLHYSLPGSLEAYYQEAGRAGRDGLPARAILIYSPKDTALHETFIQNDSPTDADLRAIHEFLRQYPAVTLDAIEGATGLPQVKTRVGLEQLEQAGVVRREPHEEFGVMHVQAMALSYETLRDIGAQNASRRRRKLALLRRMVAYAETNACRRRVILDYFGDPSPAEAGHCCDNDLVRATAAQAQGRQAETDAERAALAALEAVAGLKWGLGKEKLVMLLKGSHSRKVEMYAASPYFGRLAAWRGADLQSLVEQLMVADYVKQVGSDKPVLKLTARGEHALKARAAIRVTVHPPALAAFRKTQAVREAGGTIELTAQMLARGSSPEQIAAERGLAVGTIYSHLAQLVAAGRADVNAIVPADSILQIRAAIKQVGSVQYLAPIKARLSADIDYGMIRCVASAWTRERGDQSPLSTSASTEQAVRVQEPEELGSEENVPDLISALSDSNGNVRRLAASALGKLSAVQAVEALLALLDRETHPQVRQYAIKALGKIGDERACSKLEMIATDCSETDYNRVAARRGLRLLGGREIRIRGNAMQDAPGDQSPNLCGTESAAPGVPSPTDPIAAFLSRPHPRPLEGPWCAGWALDFHSRFDGEEQQRGLIGELVYRLKYQGERVLATQLASYWARLLGQHPDLPRPDAVISIPPSTPRKFDPAAALACALAAELKIAPFLGVLVKTRLTKPQKEMTSLAQKRANVMGAFMLQGDVRGRNIVLVDDLFDSGATVSEAARVLARGGAATIIVLTLTKTIHADA